MAILVVALKMQAVEEQRTTYVSVSGAKMCINLQLCMYIKKSKVCKHQLLCM